METNHSICIIGSGIVGSATGKGFAKHTNVIFADINPDTIRSLRGQGYVAYTINELNEQPVNYTISVLTVSTPTINGRVHTGYIEKAAKDLGRRLATTDAYHVVVVRSTVPPGTTEDIVIPAIERTSGKTAGVDFGVCMNPEYLREVSAEDDFDNPWIVVIGQLDDRSGDTLANVYKHYDAPIHRTSLRGAELQKYVHNLFNAIKIAFFNEMRLAIEHENVDPQEIFDLTIQSCEGIWNPSYGTKNMGPFTGSCLPKDTKGFLQWAKDRNIILPQLEATIQSNQAYFAQVLDKPIGQEMVSSYWKHN